MKGHLVQIVGFASIAHHIRSMGKDIKRRLKAFVANLQGPLGQISFERAVMRHLLFLLDLHRRGLTWTSIAGCEYTPKHDPSNARWIKSLACRSATAPRADWRRSETERVGQVTHGRVAVRDQRVVTQLEARQG